jgi:hypothetical protein
MHAEAPGEIPTAAAGSATASNARRYGRMPTISRFFGISIRMYFGDHAPPHFHAYYQSTAAIFLIESLELSEGGLPPRARALVLEWAFAHRAELQHNWQRLAAGLPAQDIAPLE